MWADIYINKEVNLSYVASHVAISTEIYHSSSLKKIKTQKSGAVNILGSESFYSRINKM